MVSSMTDRCFQGYLKFVHQATGITISDDRVSMIESRLRRRLLALNLNSYDEYLTLVQSDEHEQKLFVDSITTNETYFFRTPRIWEYLEQTFLPEWSSKNPNQVFKAWSAAASSGEEAHSVGILCEEFRKSQPGFRYSVLGTDISHAMIERCTEGKYTGKSIRAFQKIHPKWFERCMEPSTDDTYQVNDKIRSRLRFKVHNLFRPFPHHERYDLVLLRNVMIYFNKVDQESLLSSIEPRISDHGILIIGESESLSHVQSQFEKIVNFIYHPIPRPVTAAPIAGE